MKAGEVFVTEDTLTVPFCTKAGTLWVAVFQEDASGDVTHGLSLLVDAEGQLFETQEDEERPIPTKPPAKLLKVVPKPPEESA